MHQLWLEDAALISIQGKDSEHLRDAHQGQGDRYAGRGDLIGDRVAWDVRLLRYDWD